MTPTLPQAGAADPIHATAVVHPGAQLGRDVRVAPYAVIEDDVRVGDGCAIGAHSVLHGGCRLGHNVSVAPHAVLGGTPQDLGFRGGASTVSIGDGCVIREYVTVHRSAREGGETRLGRECLLMALSHVGHDCQIGDGVVLTSFAGLSGHIEVGDRAVVGGHAGLHQRVRVGRLAMVGGASAVSKDVPPYVIATGNPCRVRGLNVVGLRRAGVPEPARQALKRAFRVLYRSNLNTSQALAVIREQGLGSTEVEELVSFVEQSRRGLTPGLRRAADPA